MLSNERIILRPLKSEDQKYTIRWRNDPVLKVSSMMHPFPITEELEKDWYGLITDRSNKNLWFGIELKEKEILIGFTFLCNIDWISKTCDLGIVIGAKEHHGKGYGKEVMETLMHYAFNSLNLNKICLSVQAGNEAAVNLYQKLGFIQEGRLKDHFFNGGQYSDVLIFSIFKENKRDGA